MRLRLRTRVAIAFAVLALVVAGAVGAITYAYASGYLIQQRQNAALTRAILDAQAAQSALAGGRSPDEALATIPSVGTSRQLLYSEGTWHGADGLAVTDIPAALLSSAVPNGAEQRIRVAGAPMFAVAVPVDADVYVELFPLGDLDRTLRIGAWVLAGIAALAALLGGLIGRAAFGGMMRPVRSISEGAERIADGDLGTRIAETGDPDLDPIARSFNGMTAAVAERIEREERFSANVSHELRSPLTAILGTAELLESRSDELPERDSSLLHVLGDQVRRLSRTVVDLLELSRTRGEGPGARSSVDVAATCRDLLAQRGLDGVQVTGSATVVTDPRRLDRIIGNLVDNAESHGGGLVRILISASPGTLTIAIDDAGPGVPEDEAIFEPFARGTGHGTTEGSGLGLAIVREHLSALGGDVVVTRSPEGGARFVVDIPREQR